MSMSYGRIDNESPDIEIWLDEKLNDVQREMIGNAIRKIVMNNDWACVMVGPWPKEKENIDKIFGEAIQWVRENMD